MIRVGIAFCLFIGCAVPEKQQPATILTPEEQQAVDSQLREAKEEEDRKRLEEKREMEAYLSSRPEQFRTNIVAGQVLLGMTTNDVYRAWGKPGHRSISGYTFGIHENWIYGERRRIYLFFEKGILKSWHQSD